MSEKGTNGTEVSVELRSDTFTKPNKAMLEAMMNAEIGDSSYDEDPTTKELERRCAELFGKEAGLFIPSGTMSNLIAVMTFCEDRCSEVILGDKSHIHIWEQGGISRIGGVYSKQIETLPDGTFDLKKLESIIVTDYSDRWFTLTRLVCIENSHNLTGGRVLPVEFVNKLGEICRKHGLKLHLDGSRVMNAAIALDVDVKQLVKDCDSVNFCFSKGLGASFGSVLVGSKAFIEKAERNRQVLGGGMRQSGILAAACLVGLQEMNGHLKKDNENAKRLAHAVAAAGQGVVEVSKTETNIVIFRVIPESLTSKTIVDRLKEVTEAELKALNQSVRVKVSALDTRHIRMVTHRDVSQEQIDLAIRKFEFIFKELAAN